LIRLALRCKADQAEQVLAELVELAPGGVEQVDQPNGMPDMVEYAIYGAPGELPDLDLLQASTHNGLVEIESAEVPDDWEERWKRFYFPVLIAGKIYVRPPWEQSAVRGGVEEIVIDPGRAFGTGTHATTRMCLELMLEARSASCRRSVEPGLARLIGREKPGSFADLGSGSGILAIAAVKVGFDPVLAVDADRAAVLEAARNARDNNVEFGLESMDLRRDPAPVADVVAANLMAPLLKVVAQNWGEADQRPGIAILSGVTREQADEVSQAFAAIGLEERRRLVSEDWAALLVATNISDQ
jgi:ribosomal protein L11 methyltransferase